MHLHLTIENVASLANGGPIVFDAVARSFEIGRENRDWNLPDKDMFISGRHCEIRFENKDYWLFDVSRNGTFVNGSPQRISAPYRLKDGDRLQIGRYVISVALGQGDGTFATSPDRRLPGVSGQAASSGSAVNSVAPPDRDHQQHLGTPAPHGGAGGKMVSPETTLQIIAVAAGLPPDAFGQRVPEDVAREIGEVLRLVVEEMAGLLKARAAAKVMVKSADRTMIGSSNNNPFKFVPAPQEILETMFGGRRTGYMDAKASVDDAFRDLKAHEFATYAAMQAALSRLLEDLSPHTVEKKISGSLFDSRKSKAWDALVAAWDVRENAHDNGMLDVFLAYFSEAYTKAARRQ